MKADHLNLLRVKSTGPLKLSQTLKPQICTPPSHVSYWYFISSGEIKGEFSDGGWIKL